MKMMSSGVADIQRFTVKRKFDDFTEEDMNSIKKLFEEAKEFGEDENEITFLPSEEPPKFIATIIRQCKALFNIKEEVESIQVTIYPCAKGYGKTEHTIKKTKMNIASRVILCIGSREIFTINVSGAGYEGNGKILTMNGDAFQIIMGACAVADLVYDDTSSVMMAPKPNYRPRKIEKDPCKRYVIVIDGVMDAKVLVESIKKNLGTSGNKTSDVDELVQEANKNVPAPTRKPINDEDDDDN